MTRTFSKIKLKEVSGQKQGCIKTSEASNKTQQPSKLTQQHLIFPQKEKSMAYATVYSKSTYIHDYFRKTHVYTRLWRQNPHTRRKRDKKKASRQAETKFTPIRHYQVNMPPVPTQKLRNQRN